MNPPGPPTAQFAQSLPLRTAVSPSSVGSRQNLSVTTKADHRIYSDSAQTPGQTSEEQHEHEHQHRSHLSIDPERNSPGELSFTFSEFDTYQSWDSSASAYDDERQRELHSIQSTPSTSAPTSNYNSPTRPTPNWDSHSFSHKTSPLNASAQVRLPEKPTLPVKSTHLSGNSPWTGKETSHLSNLGASQTPLSSSSEELSAVTMMPSASSATSSGKPSSPISPNGTRRFDPFAPLEVSSIPSGIPQSSSPRMSDSQQLFQPQGTTEKSGGPSSENSGKVDVVNNSGMAPSAGAGRAGRPTSLYIPMEENKRPSQGGNTPTWPFSQFNGSASLDHFHPSSPSPPSRHPAVMSPSMIHPSYAAIQSNATKDLASNTSALGETSASSGDAQFHHSIDVSATTSSRPMTPSGHKSGQSSISAKHQHQPLPAANGTSPRTHVANYSVGTNTLLSSHQPLSTRIAGSMDTPTAWLVLYFSFNLGLTLFNKLVLQGFPFPWTLTAIQMLSGTIGTQIALQRGFFVQARLTSKEEWIMIAFSVLYTVNIAVSNLSLHLVTVPFHQVVRAMTPLFTIVLSAMLFRKRHSRETYIALVPVVMGVVFATYGDYYFTTWGLVLTLFGTLLAALKTIVTNRIQVGRLKLHPLDLLIRMSPLAFMQCVLCGWYSGELEKVRDYSATDMNRSKAIALFMNGVIAFGLNVVSFTANKKTSALTMTVAANVKQVLTIILAVLIFNLALNPMNMFGISLTLAGGAWYARVELMEKSRVANALSNARIANVGSGIGGNEKR